MCVCFGERSRKESRILGSCMIGVGELEVGRATEVVEFKSFEITD